MVFFSRVHLLRGRNKDDAGFVSNRQMADSLEDEQHIIQCLVLDVQGDLARDTGGDDNADLGLAADHFDYFANIQVVDVERQRSVTARGG